MAHLKAVSFKRTVTSAGTPEQLTKLNVEAISVIIQAWDDNTNGFFIEGAEAADGAAIELNARESITFTALNTGTMVIPIRLETIWIDADTSADGIAVFALVLDE